MISLQNTIACLIFYIICPSLVEILQNFQKAPKDNIVFKENYLKCCFLSFVAFHRILFSCSVTWVSGVKIQDYYKFDLIREMKCLMCILDLLYIIITRQLPYMHSYLPQLPRVLSPGIFLKRNIYIGVTSLNRTCPYPFTHTLSLS